jgi:hypothetical protein
MAEAKRIQDDTSITYFYNGNIIYKNSKRLGRLKRGRLIGSGQQIQSTTLLYGYSNSRVTQWRGQEIDYPSRIETPGTRPSDRATEKISI